MSHYLTDMNGKRLDAPSFETYDDAFDWCDLHDLEAGFDALICEDPVPHKQPWTVEDFLDALGGTNTNLSD